MKKPMLQITSLLPKKKPRQRVLKAIIISFIFHTIVFFSQKLLFELFVMEETKL
jgi:hypothetical protein